MTKSTFPNQHLFDQFIKEKHFLEGVSPETVRTYTEGWLAFHRYSNGELTESGIKDFMISMLQKGLKPGAANTYARSMNSFLTWMFENEHTSTHLKIPYQRTEKKVLSTYNPEDVAKILRYTLKHRMQKRLLAIIILLIDTGCRINEALTLTRRNIDFDNLL